MMGRWSAAGRDPSSWLPAARHSAGNCALSHDGGARCHRPGGAVAVVSGPPAGGRLLAPFLAPLRGTGSAGPSGILGGAGNCAASHGGGRWSSARRRGGRRGTGPVALRVAGHQGAIAGLRSEKVAMRAGGGDLAVDQVVDGVRLV